MIRDRKKGVGVLDDGFVCFGSLDGFGWSRGGGGGMRQAVKGASRWMRYEGLFVCLQVFTGFQLSQVWVGPCHNDVWCWGVSLVSHEVSMLYYLFKRLKPFWGMETKISSASTTNPQRMYRRLEAHCPGWRRPTLTIFSAHYFTPPTPTATAPSPHPPATEP